MAAVLRSGTRQSLQYSRGMLMAVEVKKQLRLWLYFKGGACIIIELREDVRDRQESRTHNDCRKRKGMGWFWQWEGEYHWQLGQAKLCVEQTCKGI